MDMCTERHAYFPLPRQFGTLTTIYGNGRQWPETPDHLFRMAVSLFSIGRKTGRGFWDLFPLPWLPLVMAHLQGRGSHPSRGWAVVVSSLDAGECAGGPSATLSWRRRKKKSSAVRGREDGRIFPWQISDAEKTKSRVDLPSTARASPFGECTKSGAGAAHEDRCPPQPP